MFVGPEALLLLIDGLQRLNAIISFIENSFATLDDRYFNLNYFPTAKSRAGQGLFTGADDGTGRLSQKEVSTLLDYVLALSVMRGATESEINDVFGRINTYGMALAHNRGARLHVEDARLCCQLLPPATGPMRHRGQLRAQPIDIGETRGKPQAEIRVAFRLRTEHRQVSRRTRNTLFTRPRISRGVVRWMRSCRPRYDGALSTPIIAVQTKTPALSSRPTTWTNWWTTWTI